MNKKEFSCYVIGDNNLTLQCTEVLLAHNYRILGLISPSIKIKEWCNAYSIQYIKNIKEFEKNYTKTPFDFLFSIINKEIISSHILNLPQYWAINYHNSPLPKYAGLHASSWAILNNETHHAITWHLMNNVIDAGDILKQRSFLIDHNETAFSLNLKCYEQAIQSFHELIQDIGTNSVTPFKQNLSYRTYHGLNYKPENLGFISWEQPAENIDRLCRALNFGNYANELAIPKILIKGEIFYLKSYDLLNISSKFKPGTIVSISDKSIQISTKSFDFNILRLVNLKGNYCLIKDLTKKYNLNVNELLDKPDPNFIQKISSYELSKKCGREQFWVNQYLKLAKDRISFLSSLPKSDNLKTKKISLLKTKKIPFNILNKISENFNDYSIIDILLTSTLIYFYRLNNYKNISIEFSEENILYKILDIQSFFSEYLPLTTNFHSGLTFREALETISTNYKKLKEKATYPKDIFLRYPELINITNLPDISIAFVNEKKKINLNNGKKLNVYFSENGSCFYIHNNIDYQKKSYGYFKRMYEHILTLLCDISDNPQKKIFEISILGKKEKNDLMISWNNTYKKYNFKKLLHHYFEEQVLENPNNIAAVFENESISYKELNSKSNKLANYLSCLGVKSDDIIAISLDRSLELLISIMGILKAGAAYLPLDPHYPKGRIHYMLDNSGAKYLIMDKESIKHKPEQYQGLIIEIASILSLNELSDMNLQPVNFHTNLAYVIYTSGTTGNPKGVPISHQSACNHMVWMQKKYHFQKKDIFLQKTPYSFDASVWEFFMPLMIGAKLIVAPNDIHACPIELVRLIQNNKINVLQLVPSMLKEMLVIPDFKKCISLKHIFCGGEVLLSESIRNFFKHRLENTKLHNLYGPTETTIDAVTSTCTIHDAQNTFSRIGKPIMNTKVYVLDKEKQIMPVGIIGELYISGIGLARGYLNNPQYTAQKFIANPFSNNKINDRLYKTGDLVKWQSNGYIEYHGRADCQIKIRGFRIEPSEIEACLEEISGIYQSIVKVEAKFDSNTSLVAYLVLSSEEKITFLEIRSLLKEKLPNYMIPNRFFIVDKFFFTPSGKLDRENLPKPTRQLNSEQIYSMPTTNTEMFLKNIWCSILKKDNLSIHDDFFELGGNSLSAMQIISQIKNKFSIAFNIRKIFDYPTIVGLAKEIERVGQDFTIGNIVSSNYSIENIIVPLNATGKKISVFLVHPVGGSIFWYKLLGNYLNNEISLYGIQDPGIDKKEFVFENLEEMASAYVNAIQLIQPNGPYLLGGASFGSTVAIEMAQQLKEKGDAVSSILSLDGWAFYPTLQKDEAYFKTLMEEQNSRILKKYIDNNINYSNFLLELQWNREKMLMRYKLPMISSKFILFKANLMTELFKYDARFNWWENFVKYPIELHLVPGDHETMFNDPHARILAKKINDSLIKNILTMADLS